MTRRWLEPVPVVVSHSLHEAVGGHPLVAETLVRRGVATVAAARAFLDPEAYAPTPPEDLPGIEAAVARVGRAVRTGEPILVWGDFDVDGQTATTVLVSCMRALGANVRYHIPVRDTESHGIRVPWLAEELSKGASLVVTCDTGIDAHEAVAFAASRGVDIVITDHHELPLAIPPACAVVNPHFLPDGHPLSTLPGVGVAYKLAEALYARAGRGAESADLVDLVALGVVADVAVLTGETRYLLQRGLSALRATQRLGLVELMKLAGVNQERLDEESIGFALGPRLNALGRLDDANPIVEFLTTESLGRARAMASELEALNARRRLMCDQVDAAAEEYLQKDSTHLRGAAIVLADPHWPAGIIGIVANRLAERYLRPVVLLSAPLGEPARGSARSVEGCNITDAIATQRELLDSFGGHAMAAGLSLNPANVEAFRRGLGAAVEAQLEGREAERALEIHGYVSLGELSIPWVTDLARLAPFGPGNPPLTLVARDLEIVSRRELGRGGRHLSVALEDREGDQRGVVWWNWDGAPLPDGRVDLAFAVGLNEFRGRTDVRLVWQDSRPAAGVITETVARPAVPLRVDDWRGLSDAAKLLSALLLESADVEVWDEGSAPGTWSGPRRHRLELRPAGTFVVWVRPPSPATLRAAVERVSPERLILVGRGGVGVEVPQFLSHLVALVKYALGHAEGVVSLPDLAAAMGHREASVRAGLLWMTGKGQVRIVEQGEQLLRLEMPGVADAEEVRRASSLLMGTLGETAAYWRYFLNADEAHVVAGIKGTGGAVPDTHARMG
ncbi:MAG: single-stranded-DNA-specific exonuclease RecJ, partial [Anaerolineae bacterium]|nr:single-stranded-DNA-specific exonuclease RecJ [Anaerolineae bacterium]